VRVWSPVLELRQYTLHSGARDVLIDLFDSELVEPQEETGMDIVGQFRDLDDPNRFVWLRGFPTMERRAESLAAFYGGPIWKAHRDAANATMVSSDDVLLLRPARPGSAFALAGERRGTATGRVAAWITPLDGADEGSVGRTIAELGGSMLASFVTEPSENTFPALPVRENESVFVGFAGFSDDAELPPGALRLAPTPRSLVHGGSPAGKETP
jgi:NIPSNAP